MGYIRKPYGRSPYARSPYVRAPYGAAQNRDGLIFEAPLLTSLDEVFGATPTFSRASTATYVGPDGLIKTAAINEPRFEFDSGGGALGYLSEGQRTNLLTYSEQPDNAAYTKARCSVIANAITAPDGTATADKMVEDSTAASDHRIDAPTVTITAGAASTGTWYVKAAERSWVFVRLVEGVGGGHGGSAYFDVGNGAVGTTASVGSGTLDAATMEEIGGFYRIRVTATPRAGDTTMSFQIHLATGDGVFTYDGDGSSGVYIWGAQLEEASFASSYIPTLAASVTRVVDSLVYPVSSFPPDAEGTVYAEYIPLYSAAASPPGNLQIVEASATGRFIYSNVGNLRSFDGTNVRATVNFVARREYKVSTAWSGSTLTMVVNGVAFNGNYDGTWTRVNCGIGSGNFGHVRNVQFFSVRL